MAHSSSIATPSGRLKRPTYKNKRATVRYRCAPATSGRIYFSEDLEFQPAWLQDLCLTGVGLVMNKPLDRGQVVTVQLKGASKKIYQLSAHVMHATQQSGGDWLLGLEFADKLSRDDLDDLL